MKNALLFCMLMVVEIFFNKISFAQSNTFPSTGAAGIGTTTPNASSLLDIVSASKGILIPRMTKTQRDAITLPAQGLLIYQTNSMPGFYYYDGSAWNAITPKAGANKSLNNLTAPTAVNVHLLPANAASLDLGSFSSPWRDVYYQGAIYDYGVKILSYEGSNNLLIGLTGNSTTTGNENLFTGNNTGTFNTTGSYNTAIGNLALHNNSTGLGNTAVGYGSLISNTSGKDNTGLGDSTLFNNTGSANTAIGYQAGYSNTTGNYNTVIGFQAGYSNTTASSNHFEGFQSGFSNTTGGSNTFIGYYSGNKNVTGSYNTFVGSYAGKNSTASSNHFIGFEAGFNTTSGYQNQFEGGLAGYTNTTGLANLFSGYTSGYYNTSGNYNVCLGWEAGYNNTTGFDNVCIGGLAGGYNNNSTCTIVGNNAQSSISLSNSSALGYTASITSNNQVRIGNGSVISIGGYANWSNISDGRVKKNIKTNVPGLAFINKLQPVTYNLNLDAADKIVQHPAMKDKDGNIIQPSADELTARKEKEQIVYSGFIAQDVERAAKSLNYDFSGVDAAKNDKDLYGLRYSDFVVPLVKAVQELSGQNEELAIKNDELEKRISALENVSMSDGFAKLEPGNSKPETLLGQNIPNPFDNSTLIPFRIPKDCRDASIMITNTSTSEVISVIPISCKEDHLSIDAGILAGGAYSYTLFVDGKMIATRGMIIQK